MCPTLIVIKIIHNNEANNRQYIREGLKSFRSIKDTSHVSDILKNNFQHDLLVTLHTFSSDASISVTHPNSTQHFSLKNNCSRR